MRTRLSAVLVLTLLLGVGLSPVAHAAGREAEPSRSQGFLARMELFVLSSIEKAEVFFGLAAPSTATPDPGSPTLQLDCRSAIDPNGGGCTS